MIDSTLHKRIFVVGAPRSGTTLVQSLLAANSASTSFTESHFFDAHFSRLPGTSTAILTRDPGVRVHRFLAENGEEPVAAAQGFREGNRRVLAARFLLPFYSRTVAIRLLRILDELALRRGAQNWIEKTPRHLRYVPFLERVCSGFGPPAHFVHVIRDGLEVVASLHEASKSWERPYDLATCIERWNRDVAFSLSRIAAPRDHFVFYEELASRPEPILERLVTQLGMVWEPDILERYGHTSNRLVTPEESWKAGVDRPIRQAASSDRVLDAAQRDRIRQTLRHDLYRQLAAGVRQRTGLPGNTD